MLQTIGSRRSFPAGQFRSALHRSERSRSGIGLRSVSASRGGGRTPAQSLKSPHRGGAGCVVGRVTSRSRRSWEMVPAERIELPTFGLQNRCTTAVLRRPRYPARAGQVEPHRSATCERAVTSAAGRGQASAMSRNEKPRPYGRGFHRCDRLDDHSRMSRFLVSGRKSKPITKVPSATMIGYQRPEKMLPLAATMAKAVGGRKPPNQPLPM